MNDRCIASSDLLPVMRFNDALLDNEFLIED